MTYGHYNPDENAFGKGRDIFWTDSPKISITKSEAYDFFEKVSKYYLTNHILFLYGDDFTFKDSYNNYKLADHLIDLFKNSKSYKDKIEVKYSSPDDYFEEVRKLSPKFPIIKNKDFYPYNDEELDYWTGYFTSRPYFKGLVRDAGNLLVQSSRLLFNTFVTKNKETKSLER